VTLANETQFYSYDYIIKCGEFTDILLVTDTISIYQKMTSNTTWYRYYRYRWYISYISDISTHL